MSDCIYCLDNDILKKLVTLSLFDETISSLDAKSDNIYIINTAKYVFRRHQDKARRGKIRAKEDKVINYERVIQLAESLPQIKNDVNSIRKFIDLSLISFYWKWYLKMQNYQPLKDEGICLWLISLAYYLMLPSRVFDELLQTEDIDDGEALLTTYVYQILQADPSFQALIFTGDKRYFRALASLSIPILQASLPHRFWCLEQLIHRAIGTYGFETIRDKIVPVRECDMVLKAVFGSGPLATENNSMQTLNSYIEDLRKATGNLLAPYPNQD